MVLTDEAMRAGLDDLWRLLANQDVPVARPGVRAPGLSVDTVAATLEAQGLHPEVQIVTLYSWANGYHYSEGGEDPGLAERGFPFFTPSGARLMSLHEAVDAYHQWVLWPPEVARPGWFPLMRLSNGYLVVDTQRLNSTYGQAMVVISTEAAAVVPDFRTVLQWWTQRFTDSRWRYVPESDTWGGWEDDWHALDPDTLERTSALV